MQTSQVRTQCFGWGKPKEEPPAPRQAEFSYNPQDRVVMGAGTTTLNNVGPGPSVPRAELRDATLEPVEGKYVYSDCDPRQHAAVAFASAAKTIEMFEALLGEPIHWAFGSDKLGVVPDHADREWLNAYYSRWEGSINFFHQRDPITNKTVQSGHSGEIVAHEAGHAILDALRPEYLNSWGPDVGGFHEAFGDCMALVISLQDERVLNRLMVQTGGDLSKPNLAAAMAEELGQGINDVRGENRTGGDLIRNAINNFKWQDPSTLPDRGGPDELGSEAHSFSRLWTGAFYDVLKGIAEANKAAGMAPKDAIRAAGQEGMKMMANLMKTAPRGEFTYREMAQALIQAEDRYNGGKYSGLIRQVFTDRLILPAEAPPTPEPPVPPTLATAEPRTLSLTLSGPQFGQFNGALVEVPVPAFPGKDAEIAQRALKSLERHIAAGRIRYNDPNYRMKLPDDAFDPHGQPYVGYVVWENGQMKLERSKIAT
jgi:hypothetical protein